MEVSTIQSTLSSPEDAQRARGRIAAHRRGDVAETLPLGESLFAVITGFTLIGDFRWSYQWAEMVIESGAGATYRTSTARTSATHGLAYNPMEFNNASSGHQTTGHEITADDALEPQPLGVGAGGAWGVEVPVELMAMYATSGARVWIIRGLLGAPNAFDGACNVVAAAINLGDVIARLDLAGIGIDGEGRVMIDGEGAPWATGEMRDGEGVLYRGWAVDGEGALMTVGDGVACTGEAMEAFAELSACVGFDGEGRVMIDGEGVIWNAN